jgi:hypothetical protein
VEHTFDWSGRYRLWAKNDVNTITSSEAEIQLAMSLLVLRSLTVAETLLARMIHGSMET